MNRDWRKEIPESFYKGDTEVPKAYTVGELKEHLSLLPDDLPIEQGFNKGVILIVTNIRTSPFLFFEENDE